MILKDLLEVYDDKLKQYIVIYDKTYTERARDLSWKLLNNITKDYSELLNSQVLAWGFYENKVYIKIDI